MVEILASHEDFQSEKNKVERLLLCFEQRAISSQNFTLNLTPLTECGVGRWSMPGIAAITVL